MSQENNNNVQHTDHIWPQTVYEEYCKLKERLKNPKNYDELGAIAFRDSGIVDFLEECGINGKH